MKHTLIATVTLVLFLFKISLSHAEVTPVATAKTIPNPTSGRLTPTETPEELDRIEKIKEMVASRVAELGLVEKRGIVGAVKDISNTQINITDIRGSLRSIDTDELTKFQDGDIQSKTFGISDIKREDRVSAIGLYNKQTKRLLARVITKMKPSPTLLFGTVSEKDAKNFNITIVEKESSNKTTVDIEVSTKTKLHTKKGELQRSGFSKIAKGQLVFVVGYPDTKEEGVINALRIVNFED